MFLVGDQSSYRERRIRAFLRDEPAIAVLLSAAHFEWTVSRTLLFLSKSPNVELRERLMRCSGLKRYCELWEKELGHISSYKALSAVVTNWSLFMEAFQLRHGLIHGRETCTRNTATLEVEAILLAAGQVREFCSSQGIDLHKRLPIRPRNKNSNEPARPAVAPPKAWAANHRN